jgi:hypothetical protein
MKVRVYYNVLEPPDTELQQAVHEADNVMLSRERTLLLYNGDDPEAGFVAAYRGLSWRWAVRLDGESGD